MTLASVAKTLERAFSIKAAKAVAIVINSPGGSPVQSHLIFSAFARSPKSTRRRSSSSSRTSRRRAAT
jgi:ClpP class serine protease